MRSDLTSFAARLREWIAAISGPSARPQPADQFNREEPYNSFAVELFGLQFRHNTAYRRICEARGIKPVAVEHWSQIPAVPAAAFKELELTCIPPGERTRVFYSSGTTGQRRSRHHHNRASLELYEASLWPWFSRHVLGELVAAEAVNPEASVRGGIPEPSESAGNQWRLLALTPAPAAAPNSSLVHMLDTVRRRAEAGGVVFVGDVDAEGGWTVDAARAEPALRAASGAGRPVVLLGTAFNFVHLLDGAAEAGLRFKLPAGSRVMETGGYKGRSRELLKPELHALIEERLGVPRSNIICEYGMSELSSQAYDGVSGSTPNRKLEARNFAFPPWCRVQLISPETGREVGEGRTGMVRVQDLANAFSVMALQTEDLGVRRGDGFSLIGRAVAAEPRGCSLMAA